MLLLSHPCESLHPSCEVQEATLHVTIDQIKLGHSAWILIVTSCLLTRTNVHYVPVYHVSIVIDKCEEAAMHSAPEGNEATATFITASRFKAGACLSRRAATQARLPARSSEPISGG